VYAYIDESSVGRKSSPFSTTDWSPKSFSPKVSIRPLGESVTRGRIRPLDQKVTREEKINVDAKADGIIRREYSAWANRHGKVKCAKRFEIFKRNFVLQMEMNRKNQEFFLLNEFGDLTEAEYISFLQKSQKSKGKEENEFEAPKKARQKITATSPETLEPAPIKSLEDLTKEVLESAMKSSRKAMAEKEEAILEIGKAESTEKFTNVQAIWRSMDEEIRSTEFHRLIPETYHTESVTSYTDLLYTQMQPLDGFVLRPALMSAAIVLSSETILNHLIEEIDDGWEKYSYAIDFEDYSDGTDTPMFLSVLP
jgi:hypothetical protein